MSRSGRWALAGAAVSVALALALIDPYLFTGGDNALYYALAKALATGQGYVDLISPGTPGPATQYPPGFPVLLVPFYWLGGGSMVVLKLESLLAGAVVLWATWTLAREARGVPEWVAAAAVWLVGLAPVFRIYTSYVLSDMSFTAVGMVALVFFQRAARAEEETGSGPAKRERAEREHRGKARGWWIAGALLAAFAFAVRTAGVALLGAALLVSVFHRRWRRAAWVVAAIALAVVPWLAWTAQSPPETGGYLELIRVSDRLNPESPPVRPGEYVQRAAANLTVYTLRDLPELFWPEAARPPLAVTVFGAVAGVALLALGAFHLVRRRGLAVWQIYAVLTIAVLLVWPWTGDRFFLTVMPIFWIVMLCGLERVFAFFTGRSAPARWAATALIVFLLVGAARQIPDQWEVTRAYLDGDELAGYDPFWKDYFEAARWIGQNEPGAVITARKPTLAWYWSERPSIVYPFHGDPERTWAFLREKGVTHILMDPMTRDFLRPTLVPRVELLEVIHAAPHRAVFVVRIAPGE